ncbi:hypothetical protein BC827DRAFT_1265610 [Russula dissimulans]|nr:hypothetical protein BC827DRAFT_1265610 [Russula dissimulans]
MSRDLPAMKGDDPAKGDNPNAPTMPVTLLRAQGPDVGGLRSDASTRRFVLTLPNGDPIPNDGSGRGLKHAIDTWLAANSVIASDPPTSLLTLSPHDKPPHLAYSFEIVKQEAHMAQITDVMDEPMDKPMDELYNIEVFNMERKKRQSKLPEVQPQAPAASSNASPQPTPDASRHMPQFQYQAAAEKPQLVDELLNIALEIDILVGEHSTVAGIIDPGSQIIAICKELADEVAAYTNTDNHLEMEGVNSATSWTAGCVEYLTLQISGISFKTHAHVVEHAPYRLLLGQPALELLNFGLKYKPGGNASITITDP